eukprot:gene15937-33554_t
MSDPSAIQIPIGTALTSDMLLGLKPSAPKSRSYRINIAPLNKSVFSPSDQIIIELPTGRKGTWLDQSQSYLKFSVQFASTAATVAAPETQNEYGQLCNFLLDTSLAQSDKAGLSGMIGSNPYNTMVNGGAFVANGIMQNTQVAGDRSGLAVASVTTAAGLNAAIPYTFCLPLLSGVVGVN